MGLVELVESGEKGQLHAGAEHIRRDASYSFEIGLGKFIFIEVLFRCFYVLNIFLEQLAQNLFFGFVG